MQNTLEGPVFRCFTSKLNFVICSLFGVLSLAFQHLFKKSNHVCLVSHPSLHICSELLDNLLQSLCNKVDHACWSHNLLFLLLCFDQLLKVLILGFYVGDQSVFLLKLLHSTSSYDLFDLLKVKEGVIESISKSKELVSKQFLLLFQQFSGLKQLFN